MHKAYSGILTAVLVISIGAALLLGNTTLSLIDLIQGQPDTWQVLLTYRVPRVLVAVISGTMIGLSSILLQVVLRNRLVDASIIGLMNGTQFMMLCVIVLLPFLTQANVLIAGVFGVAISIGWHVVMPKKQSSMQVILIGVATAMTFQALTQLTTTGFGVPLPTLSTVTWAQVMQLIGLLLVGMMLLIVVYPQLKYFALSSEQVRLLKINERTTVYLVLMIVGLWSGAVTSLLGVIFFFGAVLPQISRLIMPRAKSHALYVPTALWGSILILNADTIARTIVAPTELPASAVLLALSGPLFVLLLMKGGR